jgi:hypothetical protein
MNQPIMSRADYDDRRNPSISRRLRLLCATSVLLLGVGMYGIRVLGSSARLVGAVLSAQSQPAPSGAIHGVVVRSGTGEALARAVVELRADDDRAAAIVSSTTESDGHFLFRNVGPGTYRLVVARSGFVNRSISVILDAGRTQAVTVTMTLTAALAGRVYTPNGEPLGNVEVTALKSSYQNGRRVLTAMQSVQTDDRGEYRLFWLPPGRYVVKATHPQAQTGLMAMLGPARISGGFQITSGGGLGPNGFFSVRGTGDPVLADAFGLGVDASADRYVPVYFPGTIDDQTAGVIDVRSGADIGAIDIPVAPVRERQVRGVVVNGATGQMAQYASLSEVPAESWQDGPTGGLGGGGLSNRGQKPMNPDGSFEVTLLPGRHTLRGIAGTGEGFVTLDLRDADLDGVRIVAMPSFNITGRILTDAAGGDADLTSVRISMWRELGMTTPSSSYSLPRANGTFVLAATPGDYRVNVAPFLNLAPGLGRFMVSVPKGFEQAYVKSIRLGALDALNERLHLEGPTASPLEIVLGMNPGKAEGTVVTGAQAIVAGATVVLLPDLRGRFDLVRTATTDASGRFRVDRVVPGPYKLFAWNEVNDGDWQDPEFMRALEGHGTAVRIEAGASARVQLMLVP